MLKKYLLLFIIFISIFVLGCKDKVSYEGTLIHKNDLPFVGYASSFDYPERDIFLKTSISDSKFSDGVRYYLIFPKDGKYQDFKNNLGQKVKVKGEEEYNIAQVNIYYYESPDYDGPPQYPSLNTYCLKESKIVKVY